MTSLVPGPGRRGSMSVTWLALLPSSPCPKAPIQRHGSKLIYLPSSALTQLVRGCGTYCGGSVRSPLWLLHEVILWGVHLPTLDAVGVQGKVVPRRRVWYALEEVSREAPRPGKPFGKEDRKSVG